MIGRRSCGVSVGISGSAPRLEAEFRAHLVSEATHARTLWLLHNIKTVRDLVVSTGPESVPAGVRAIGTTYAYLRPFSTLEYGIRFWRDLSSTSLSLAVLALDGAVGVSALGAT